MRSRNSLCLLAIFICGTLFYSLISWSNPFVFDDILKLQENSDLKPGSSIAETLLYPYTQNATNLLRNDPSRPLTFLIYRLCYQIGDGQPWPFHVTSSLFHSLNAMLVFLLVGLFTRRVFKSESVVPGVLAAFFFLMVPINSGTVLYAFAFSDVIAAFFVLSAVYIFVREPSTKPAAYAASMVLFFCALFSKQSAIVLPALILVTDFLLNQVHRKRVYQYAGFATLAVVYVVFRYVFFGGIGDLEGTGNTYAALDYLKLQGPMILKYVMLTLIPTGLALDHAPIPSAYQLWVIALSWLLITSLALVALKFLYKKNIPWIAKLSAWFWIFFLITLSPTSSFVPTVDLFVERRVYMGSVAFAALFGLLLTRIPKKHLGVIVGSVILVLLTAVSWGRSEVYANPELLWLESVHQYPHSKRARANIAYTYDQQGRYEEARKIYEDILLQYPDDAFIHTKLALIFQNPRYQGHSPQKAFESYKKALEINPNDIVTLYNMGLLLLDAGSYDQAEALFRRSLEINPRFVHGVFGLGMTLVKKGQTAEGKAALEKALEIDPQFQGAREQLQLLQE
ncbi:MAG: tetratricopeptide repeat protein [Bdellovibrionales bacterium]|nr:tetratricopeptide repeat protein [Bdellovibrionales bacterium]